MQRIYRLVPSEIVKGPIRIDIAFPEMLAYRQHPEERLFLVPTRDVQTAATLLRTAGVTVYVGVTDAPALEPLNA